VTGEFGQSGECGECGETGGSLAKLELRLVDVQRLDAMVECGWWHAKLRRGSGSPRNAALGYSERRFDDLSLALGRAL
jgi:hypothetical protein